MQYISKIYVYTYISIVYTHTHTHIPSIFFKDFIYLLLERGEGRGEREEQKHQCVRDTLICCLSHAPKWGPYPQPGMCPDWESNWQPFGSTFWPVLNPLSHTSQGTYMFCCDYFFLNEKRIGESSHMPAVCCSPLIQSSVPTSLLWDKAHLLLRQD